MMSKRESCNPSASIGGGRLSVIVCYMMVMIYLRRGSGDVVDVVWGRESRCCNKGRTWEGMGLGVSGFLGWLGTMGLGLKLAVQEVVYALMVGKKDLMYNV